MRVLEKIRAYQRQAAMATQTEPIQPQAQLLEPQALPAGATLPPDRSFLQQYFFEQLKEHNVPTAMLKHLPLIGPIADKLLYGNPFEAHTFLSDAVMFFDELLKRDVEHDPVVQARKQAYAEAEERANERNRASAPATDGGPVHDFGQDWKRQEYIAGPPATAIPESLPDEPGTDYRQQAEI